MLTFLPRCTSVLLCKLLNSVYSWMHYVGHISHLKIGFKNAAMHRNFSQADSIRLIRSLCLRDLECSSSLIWSDSQFALSVLASYPRPPSACRWPPPAPKRQCWVLSGDWRGPDSILSLPFQNEHCAVQSARVSAEPRLPAGCGPSGRTCCPSDSCTAPVTAAVLSAR